MRLSILLRPALGVGLASVLMAGCGGPQSQVGSLGSPQSLASLHGSSWVSPEAKKSKELLYISNFNNGTISIFSYPKEKLVGTLSNLSPVGMCVDKSGDVFIPERFGDSVYEYAPGGTTPIATLNDGYESGTCSVDPKTGNLAVGNITTNFAIFPYEGSGQFGTVQIYTAPSGFSSVNSVGYDDSGNLFFQGSNDSNGNIEGWLPNGSSNAELLNLNVSIASPGQVQWDGKYITFTDRNTADIYEITASGSSGTEVGSLLLNLTSDQDRAGWISTKLKEVFVPQFNSNEVLVYKYPSGTPVSKKTINSGLDGAWGVTLSIAKK